MLRHRWRRVALLIALSASLAAAWLHGRPGRDTRRFPEGAAHRIEAEQPALPLKQLVRDAGLKWPPPGVRVVVRKADHAVELHAGANLLKTYPAAFGSLDGEPAFDRGPKRRQGDRKTPEGDYLICTRNDKSPYHLFLGISYPNATDAEQGRAAGLIGAQQARAIAQAQRRGACPPWDTPLGGAIGLHGGGFASEWTWGCIALSDSAIEELWAVCPIGTPVRIGP